MTVLKQYGKYIGIGVVLLILIIGSIVKKPVETPEIYVPVAESEQIVETTYIYVDLKGAVQNPGVYKVERSARLFQIVSMAGGLREDADQNAINLSMILADQDVVYVPTLDEEYPNISIPTDPTNPSVININSATLEQLETLPGIGPSTAQKIIDYRQENGLFETIEDIMNVSGIGESTFEEIKDSITT